MNPDKDSEAPIVAIRLEHEATGKDYIALKFIRSNGRGEEQLVLPASIALQDKRGTRKQLIDHGAVIADDLEIDALIDPEQPVGSFFDSPGWKANNQAFEFPDDSVGDTDFPAFFDKESLCCRYLTKPSGSLRRWKLRVAREIGKSDAAAMPLLASFAASLMQWSGLTESFVLNLAGNSSCGKSTAVRAAYSVWANPANMPSWHATPRGLEEAAVAHNDVCFAVDDLERSALNSEQRLRKLHDSTHMLSSGETKSYSQSISKNGPLAFRKFRSVTLTSSPACIQDAMSAAEVERTDGDRVRLLEILVPNGDEGGIWFRQKRSDPNISTKELSDRVYEAALANYGVAGRHWVAWLIRHRRDLRGRIRRLSRDFIAAAAPDYSDVRARIAAKVGLLYAAGMLAREAGVIGWSEVRIRTICKRGLKSILDAAFPAKAGLPKITHQLFRFFQSSDYFPRYSSKRLCEIAVPDHAKGFVLVGANGKDRVYARLEELEDYLKQILPGRSGQSAKGILQKYKLMQIIVSGGTSGLTDDPRLKGKRQRFVVFDAEGLRRVIRQAR